MNKQQLAAKIWESANQMRSKIEANEYKDYILGFIFYKYLSDQLVQFVSNQGMTADDIKNLNESDAETVEFVQSNRGYFIAYDNLFSTWIDPTSDFDESNSVVAIKAKNNFSTEFLFDALGNQKTDLEEAATTNAQANINLQILMSHEIMAPKLSEQTQIGNYFKKLDALINQQQQITKLNNIKQACLSKMFV